MMMPCICSCTNKKQPTAIYPFGYICHEAMSTPAGVDTFTHGVKMRPWTLAACTQSPLTVMLCAENAAEFSSATTLGWRTPSLTKNSGRCTNCFLHNSWLQAVGGWG